jgi:hypothetical protein
MDPERKGVVRNKPSWLGWVPGLVPRRERAEQQLDAELRFDYDQRVA